MGDGWLEDCELPAVEVREWNIGAIVECLRQGWE